MPCYLRQCGPREEVVESCAATVAPYASRGELSGLASAIENSIRRAIGKGDGDDPDFRVIVYEAAERAILRGEADGKTTAAEGEERRRELIAAVEAIEAEYPAQVAGAGGEAAFASTPDASDASTDGIVLDPNAVPGATFDASAAGESSPKVGEPETALPGDDIDRPGAEPGFAPAAVAEDGTASPPGEAKAETWIPGRGRAAPSASRYPRRLVAIVIVALLAFLVFIGAYLLLPLLLPNLFASGSAPQAEADPIAAAIRSASDEGGQAAGDAWTTAFSPDDTTGFEAGPRGTVSAVTGPGERAAVRIAAKGPAEGAEPAIVAALIVAAGTVSGLAGQSVRSELTVGSPDGMPREFTVSCHIGGQSICGRQRFSTKVDSQSFVFDMDVPQAASGAARLLIDPSLGGGASDLNVFRLRLKSV